MHKLQKYKRYNMDVKTINLKNDEYFALPKTEHEIFFLNGARGSGKSYFCKLEVLKMLEEDDNAIFFYVRMQQSELATVNTWVIEMLPKLLKLCQGSEFCEVKRSYSFKGDITLLGYDMVNDKKVINFERVIGFLTSLETSSEIKSTYYEKCKIIVFEEYSRFRLNVSLEETCTVNFIELVETVLREKKGQVFMIGNSLKTIPILESAFLEADNCIKYKILKRRDESKGVLRGVSDKYKKYLEGEQIETGYEKVKDYIPIYTTKKYTIYICKYGSNNIMFNTVSLNKIKNVYGMKYHVNNIVKRGNNNNWVYPNYKSEIYLKNNIDGVIDELKTLL